MKKIYINIEIEIEKIIFKYKDEIIIVINKKEICSSTNTSHN